MLQRLCNLLGARFYDAEAGDFIDLVQKGLDLLKSQPSPVSHSTSSPSASRGVVEWSLSIHSSCTRFTGRLDQTLGLSGALR